MTRISTQIIEKLQQHSVHCTQGETLLKTIDLIEDLQKQIEFLESLLPHEQHTNTIL